MEWERNVREKPITSVTFVMDRKKSSRVWLGLKPWSIRKSFRGAEAPLFHAIALTHAVTSINDRPLSSSNCSDLAACSDLALFFHQLLQRLLVRRARNPALGHDCGNVLRRSYIESRILHSDALGRNRLTGDMRD